MSTPGQPWKVDRIRADDGIEFVTVGGGSVKCLVLSRLTTGRMTATLWKTADRGGEDVTKKLSQADWREIYDQIMAAHALLGSKPVNLVKEII